MTRAIEAVVCSDFHGDQHDRATVEALLAHADDRRRKGSAKVYFLGDLIDARPFRSGASRAERLERIQADFDAAVKFLKELRPDVICWGNHDARLWDVAGAGLGPISDYARLMLRDLGVVARSVGARTFPYCKRRGVVRLGPVRLLHGYYGGKAAARAHAMTYGDCVFGHVHAPDSAAVVCAGRVRTAHSIGALCRLDFAYNRAHGDSLRQERGWAQLFVVGDSHVLHHVRPAGGGSFVTVDGVGVTGGTARCSAD